MTQQVKQSPTMPTSHINFRLYSGWLTSILAPCLCAYQSIRQWHKCFMHYLPNRNLEETPNSWFRIDTTLVVVITWRVNKRMEDLSVSLSSPSLTACHFAFEINK